MPPFQVIVSVGVFDEITQVFDAFESYLTASIRMSLNYSFSEKCTKIGVFARRTPTKFSSCG